MSIKLTKKQQRLLDFIKEYTENVGVSPSYRDIAAGLGLKSVSAIAEHVENLVTLGALRRTPGAGRTLEVVDISYTETTTLFRARLNTCSEEDRWTLLRAADILHLDLGDVATETLPASDPAVPPLEPTKDIINKEEHE